MKNNKKGFIAISLIYSFFLVFLVTLLSIVNSYAHNRVLLNNIKKEIKTSLESAPDFLMSDDLNKSFNTGDVLNILGEEWQVLKDEDSTLLLILNRNLSIEEINYSLDKLNLSITSAELMPMCLSYTYRSYCNNRREYRWGVSVVKNIIENWEWFGANESALNNMNYYDGRSSYTSKIRIPQSSEYDLISDSYKDDIWYLTKGHGNSIEAYNEDISVMDVRLIHPVILIDKSI